MKQDELNGMAVVLTLPREPKAPVGVTLRQTLMEWSNRVINKMVELGLMNGRVLMSARHLMEFYANHLFIPRKDFSDSQAWVCGKVEGWCSEGTIDISIVIDPDLEDCLVLIDRDMVRKFRVDLTDNPYMDGLPEPPDSPDESQGEE